MSDRPQTTSLKRQKNPRGSPLRTLRPSALPTLKSIQRWIVHVHLVLLNFLCLSFHKDAHQIIYSGAGTSSQDAESRSFADPPTANHDEVSAAPPAVATSALLPLQCRICDAPPTVNMRPTATMCGHVFCYEYVSRTLSSVARLTLHQMHHPTRNVDS